MPERTSTGTLSEKRSWRPPEEADQTGGGVPNRVVKSEQAGDAGGQRPVDPGVPKQAEMGLEGWSSGQGETRVLDRFAAGGCNRSRRSSLHRPKRMLHTRGLPGHQHCRRPPPLRFTLLTNYSNKPSPPLLTPGSSGKTPDTGPGQRTGQGEASACWTSPRPRPTC